MPVERVEVVGLRDFQRALRRVDQDLPKQLRVVNLRMAEMVANDARARASALGGIAAKSAPSIKAMAQQRSAAVRIGGRRYPFALGAEFGSIQFKQFKAWRGNQHSFKGVAFVNHTTGYFLYPAIRANHQKILDTYLDAAADVAREAFPN